MKKIMLLLAILFAGTTFVSAQNSDLDKWATKVESSDNQIAPKNKRVPNVVKDAGFYLEKSAKFQYAAIGCLGATAALSTVAALLPSDKPEIGEDGHLKMKKNNVRTACYIGAGACAVVAICFEFASINYKLKAGKSLKLFSTGTGGGLAYTF